MVVKNSTPVESLAPLPGVKILPVSETAPKEIYSRAEVRRLLAVTERQLRDWERHQLIRPAESFALPDLIALKTLIKLREDRFRPAQIRSALTALRACLRDVGDPLRELRVVTDGRRIRVELAGQRMESSGQLLLNFDKAELRRLLNFPAAGEQSRSAKADRQQAERWFQKGLQLEYTGSTSEAIQAYEAAVGLDAQSAGAWLNLGTIHFNARRFNQAETYYRKALEADPSYALAHFNLGNLYDERGDYERAVRHYSQAVELHPNYADAHYNLALLHQGSGQTMEAVRHWKTYLKLDPGSSWAAIARRELDKLRRSAVVSSPPTRRSSGRNKLLD